MPPPGVCVLNSSLTRSKSLPKASTNFERSVAAFGVWNSGDRATLANGAVSKRKQRMLKLVDLRRFMVTELNGEDRGSCAIEMPASLRDAMLRGDPMATSFGGLRGS